MSNQPDAPNPAIASRLQTGRHWRGVGDPTSEGNRATFFLSFLRGHLSGQLARSGGDR